MDVFENDAALDTGVLYILRINLLIQYALVRLTFWQYELIVIVLALSWLFMVFKVTRILKLLKSLVLFHFASAEILIFIFLVKFKIWLSQEMTPNMLVKVALLGES
jgi:hypothetical protein|tara:strand:+ start:335 stop:652 length:318 start_codon:yes stop_codon:yes gene_type:complete